MMEIYVACNALVTVPNAPLASATGKEFHLPTWSMLEIHGSQVKREREYRGYYPHFVYISVLCGYYPHFVEISAFRGYYPHSVRSISHILLI